MSSVQLGDVAELITKGTTPTTVGGSFTVAGINFVKSESIADSKYLNSTIFGKIDEKTDEKLKRSRLKKDDLLFSIAGAYLGKVVIVRKCDIPANTNQAVGIVRLKHNIVDKDYAYYFYSQKHIVSYINSLSSQSAQPNLNLDLLGRLPFDLRKLESQQKIAAILTALDAKIDCNNRINAELEAMVKTLYDYWFVQFDFPDANGKPYKSSGGKMVYNATLKREIPAGWEAVSISNLVDIRTGKEDANYAAEDGQYHFFTCGEAPLRCNEFVFDGKAVLLAGNGSFSVKRYEGKFNAYQRTYVLIAHEPALFPPLYFVVNDRVKTLASGSRGSIVKFITKGDIEDIYLPLPKYRNFNFITVLASCFSQSSRGYEQNLELKRLRDWLLPLLMNGQVTVA